jgi:hypothetical protein
MPTKRKKTKAISREGVNYVRSIVEKQNSIFQEIDLDNDVGNDAYIEFILSESATGCCIATQIKSGASFYTQDQDRYTLKSDRAHFEYWQSHILPVAGIVYNPKKEEAVWCDITEYLSRNPEQIKNGPYCIHISSDCVFNSESFPKFRDHFLKYREIFKLTENFGLALECFANLQEVEVCLNGIRSLFSFHRQRPESWYYLISCFRNFHNHPLAKTLAIALCHIPGHSDIYWHKGNLTDESVRQFALSFIKSYFKREEVIQLLELIDDLGISRGSIGQCVHAVIDIIQSRNNILSSIAFDEAIEADTRYWALFFWIYYRQGTSLAHCIKFLMAYLERFPNDENCRLVDDLKNIIKEHGAISFY